MSTSSTRKLPKPPKRRALLYKGTRQHPDQRPCPPWCWVAADNPKGRYSHEIETDHPFEATHHSDKAFSIAASQYQGRPAADPCDVFTATLELHLEQRGQGDPMIDVALRDYHNERDDDGRWHWRMNYDDERLKLSVEDARELIAMLEHVVGLTELPPE